MIAVLHHLHLSVMHSNLITMLYTTCLTGEWRRMLTSPSLVQHVLHVSEVFHIKAFIHLLEELHMSSAFFAFHVKKKQYF